MTKFGGNGTSIAKLKSADGKVIGWVVLWDNSELAVLWIDDEYDPVEIDPPLDLKTLETAKSVYTDSITELLETLSANQNGRSKE